MSLHRIWIQLLVAFFLFFTHQELSAARSQKSHKQQVQRVLTEKEQALVQHVINSIANAEAGVSKISPQAFSIPGMTGAKVRHFLNNLCSIPRTSYLEIGCWKGSTLVSALYGNEAVLTDAIAVENFSQFEGPRAEFLHNIQTFIPKAPLRFLETDCFSIDKKAAFSKPITVYFYDGGHAFTEQYKAFTEFNTVFDDVFIAIVDDWNWGEVRDGTKTAFKDLGYEILFEKAFLTSANGDPHTWWNGIYVAVIRK